ncbi:MAG: amino acid ABC transporter permease [Clostridia bacterium]|nr:amino acid ABC transporter permease [Clostridia bacterium]
MRKTEKFKVNIFDKFYEAVIYQDWWQWYLSGLGKTLLISLGAILIGVILGIIVALTKYTYKKFGNFKIGNGVCDLYLAIFRGTPVYVQLLIMYLIVLIFLPTVWVAIITFGINSGAYVAEIIRGGLESVDDGQIEAGRALGLNKLQVMVKIVLPQGFRVALPPLFNEFIALVKETSIVGTIGEVDLTKVAARIVARTYEPFVPYVMIALMYLVVVIALTKLLKMMERRLAKGERHRT